MLKIIIFIVLIIIVLLIALGYYLFDSVLNQDEFRKSSYNEEEIPNPLMAPTQHELFINSLPLKEKMKAFEYEELEIKSFDGLKLHGYLLKGNPKEVVLLYHGYRSSKENDFCDKIEIYLKRNSTILLVDVRGHYKSEGKYLGFSELDKYDIISWTGKINELYDNPSIYLHGVSMGGASVIHCANLKLKNVKGIIDDCGFDSISHLTRSIIKNCFHIPYFPIGNIAAFFSKQIAHVDFYASDGYKCVEESAIPIVFIHGTDDHFVPVKMSQELYKRCKAPKELLLVVGAGHSASYLKNPKGYSALVNRLLDGEIK